MVANVVLVARSSSHFSRVARMFALELAVPFDFRPVLDMTSADAADYAGNPALKVPILIDEQGALFGTENICRTLARRSPAGVSVVLRGDVDDRLVANAEELTLHVMSSEVSLIMAKIQGTAPPPKVVRSIENALDWLDDNLAAALSALPGDRAVSFVEVALFCLLTHLPWRQVMDVSRWTRLSAFCARFGERASAQATEYRFDAQP